MTGGLASELSEIMPLLRAEQSHCHILTGEW